LKVRESRKAEILIILGIVLVMVAPYLPNFFFEGFLLEAENHGAIRYVEVIPSVRLGGMLFFAWGITILLKRSV
jgi:hypothetical protein